MQTLTTKAEQYLNERWQPQRDYYSKQSAQNKQWHQSLLVFSTIGALIVPVLLNIAEVPKLVPTALSIWSQSRLPWRMCIIMGTIGALSDKHSKP